MSAKQTELDKLKRENDKLKRELDEYKKQAYDRGVRVSQLKHKCWTLAEMLAFELKNGPEE